MATAEKLQSDFLSCSICYDVYKCPKSLPCLHTFCQKCLESYIMAENDTYGVERKSCFPCPICRCIVRPKYSFKPLSRWTEDFPTNFFIEGLISTFMTEKDEQTTSSSPIPGPGRRGLPSFQNDWDIEGNFAIPPEYISDFRADDIVVENPVITDLPRVKSSKAYKLVKTLYGIKKSGEAKFNAVFVLKERIVALDFQNQLVQMFYNWQAKLDVNVMIDTLELPTKPDSMVAINDSMVVVSLPSRKELCIISVDGQDPAHPKLEVVYSIKTLKSYKCVKRLPSGKLLVTASDVESYMCRKLALDVLGHSGDYLHSIRYDSDLKSVIPTSVSVDPAGQIYILSMENKMYCLTQDGREVFRYDPKDGEDEFQRLQSLEYGHGNIYLADMDAHLVLMLRNECGFPTSCEILLSKENGICKPMDVGVGPDGTLYVACWDGCVRVYAVEPSPPILKNKVLETTL